MENQNHSGYRISRRSLLGSLGVLAISPTEALRRDFKLSAPASVDAKEREWAKHPVVPNKVQNKIQPLEYATQSLHPESFLGRRLDLNTQIGLLKTIDIDSYLLAYRERTRPLWPSGEYLGSSCRATRGCISIQAIPNSSRKCS